MGHDQATAADLLAAGLEEARRRIAALEAAAASSAGGEFATHMLDGFSRLSPEGVHLDVNPALCAMTGFSREELIGAGPPHPYWPPEEYGAIEAAFSRTLGGAPETFSLTFMRKDGERFPALVTPSVIRDADGTIVAAFATVKDVGQLRRIEAALAESEQLFRLTFEQAPIGAALVGLDFRFQRVNARFAEMTGYTASELLERGFPDVTHPDDAADDVTEVRRLVAGEIEEYAREKRYVRKDGSIVWGDVVVRPVAGDDGRPLALIAMVADITTRREAQLAVLRERDRAQSYLDIAGVMLVAIGADQNVLLANRKTCEVLERDEAEIVGSNWFDVILPEADRETILDLFAQLMADNVAPWGYVENRVLTSTGAERLIAWHNTVIKGEDGTIVATLSSGEDITARRQTEQLLALPSEILGIIAAPIAVRETAAGIVAALRQATGFDAVGIRLQEAEDYPFIASVGYTDEFLEAENALAVRYPDGGLCREANGSVSLECTCGLVIAGDIDAANPLFTPGGSAWTNDSLPFLDVPPEDDPRLHPRNRCIHVGFRSLALVPLRAGEEILGLLHLADRRTGRFTPDSIRFFEGVGASIGAGLASRRVQEELRESEERLRTVLLAVSEGIVLQARDGRVLLWNEGAERVFGVSQSEIVGESALGRDWGAIREDGSDWPPAEHPSMQALRTGESQSNVVMGVRQAGAVRWINVNAQPLFLPDEAEAYAAVVSFADITERRQAEDEIRRLNAELTERVVNRTEQLDATTRELEALAYSIAHDVRAPLRSIDGFSAAAIEDEGDRLSPEGVEDLRRVRTAAQTLARLLDDLMGLSHVSQRELVRQAVDLSALALAVAAENAADHPSRVVEFIVPSGLIADADPNLLRLILRELLGNAWKFTAPHDSARVEVGAVDADGERAFFVRDDGVGFDMRYAEHLFGAFQRMHQPEEFEGDGVGLATVQRLVRRHGGRACAEAEPGKGATFFFTLPAPGET
jgi:PAS domain S-box-containing protein